MEKHMIKFILILQMIAIGIVACSYNYLPSSEDSLQTTECYADFEVVESFEDIIGEYSNFLLAYHTADVTLMLNSDSTIFGEESRYESSGPMHYKIKGSYKFSNGLISTDSIAMEYVDDYHHIRSFYDKNEIPRKFKYSILTFDTYKVMKNGDEIFIIPVISQGDSLRNVSSFYRRRLENLGFPILVKSKLEEQIRINEKLRDSTYINIISTDSSSLILDIYHPYITYKVKIYSFEINFRKVGEMMLISGISMKNNMVTLNRLSEIYKEYGAKFAHDMIVCSNKSIGFSSEKFAEKMKDGIDESASLKKKFNVLHENFLDLSNNEKLELLKTLTLKYK
jgi:hypothetical protein